MSSRSIVIIISVVVIGFTLMSIRNYLTSNPVIGDNEPRPQIRRIMIAKNNIASGSFIKVQRDFDWREYSEIEESKARESNQGKIPKESYLYEGTFNLGSFEGAVVRRSISAGDPIVASMLMRSGEGGFMSAVLGAGKRAVTISVNPVSGNAGFVSPGDNVDLLITYSTRKPVNGMESVITETFLKNIRVLAVDQALENPENKAIVAKTITVEVSSEEAEKISVAAEMGKISLALVSTAIPDENILFKKNVDSRSKKDNLNEVKNDKVKHTLYTSDGDVSNLMAEKESAISKVRIIRGKDIEVLEFYQGVK
ncbi:MAG: Flp pilus assembly protein CpaB [Rickettsiales bacterium]